MKALTKNSAVRHEQGFEVYSLKSEEVELAVVPELGAKIISLRDRRTGREWLWHPQDGLKLFRNRPGDNFSQSPLVGIDECFPTIEPCLWQERSLPDHGELWNRAWRIYPDAWENGILRTDARLSISPFKFGRTIELCGNEVRISYELTNLAATPEKYLWAIHPLLRLRPGDQLELPASTRALLNGEGWVDAIDTAVPKQNCGKLFAFPVREGRVAVNNYGRSDRLELEWDPTRNNTLGLWLTRGGWHGHHHFAIEPTNSDVDALASAVERKRCGTIRGHSSIGWQLALRVGL